LGGLLNPEAYITATRQCIAQANSWSLEELVLDVTITDGGPDSNKPSLDECSFGVVGKFIVIAELVCQLLRVQRMKAIPLQALTGPEGSRRLRLPDVKTISI
jgi:hypothetical protein